MVISLVDELRADAAAGGERAVAVAVADETGHLVEREPVPHAVPQPLHDRIGVRAEGVGRRPDEPAAAVLEPLRVRRPVALREDPGPGDRKTIVADAELPHQGGVGLVPMVVVAGNLRRVAALDAAGRGGEAVPDRLPLAILARRPLDLRRG